MHVILVIKNVLMLKGLGFVKKVFKKKVVELKWFVTCITWKWSSRKVKVRRHGNSGLPKEIKIYGNFKASKGYSNNMLL